MQEKKPAKPLRLPLSHLTVPLRILLVEDKPLDTELALAAIEHAGYSTAAVERVETPEEFLRELTR